MLKKALGFSFVFLVQFACRKYFLISYYIDFEVLNARY